MKRVGRPRKWNGWTKVRYLRTHYPTGWIEPLYQAGHIETYDTHGESGQRVVQALLDAGEAEIVKETKP